MSPRPFTPEDDALIVRYFTRETLSAIAGRLGRSPQNVAAHSHILERRGLVRANHRYTRRSWTATEDAELRGRLGWDSLATIARLLHRTVTAVKLRAERLGVSVSPRCLSAHSLGKLLDVDAKQVIWWIAQGWLNGQRSATGAGRYQRWEIDGEALRTFLRAYPDRYEARRISDPYLRKIADQAAARAEWVTVEQAARQVGVHRGTIRRHLRNGWLTGEQVPGGGGQHWRVRAADLERFERRKAAVRLSYRKGHCGALKRGAA